jgi:hypothetical protein
MKKFSTLSLILLITCGIFAQAPQKMSYQAVIRNSSNQLVTNAQVGMKISILQGSASGTLVYQEIYNPNPQTNANGLVTVEIGGGLVLSGTFSAIDWSAGPYYLKTETDPSGGTSYTIVGISQLLSVPYALYSGTSASFNETDPKWSGAANQTGQIGRSGNVGIGTTSPTAPLHVAGKVRIVDGTQGNNKILASDASGNSSWVGAPGVDFVENGGGTTVSTLAASSNIGSVTITAPGPGYIIVTASGTLYHNIGATSGLLIRVKVSDTNNDVGETPGIQFIRMYGFPVSSGINMYPFSVSKVFTVNAAGNYTYYLNIWHQTVNGTILTDDHTLIGNFVPYRY